MERTFQAFIQDIRASMPELPEETANRLGKLGLTPRDTEVLMAVDSGREVGYDGVLGQGAVAYFDAVSHGREPKVVVNWYGKEATTRVEIYSLLLQDEPRASGTISSPTGDLLSEPDVRRANGGLDRFGPEKTNYR